MTYGVNLSVFIIDNQQVSFEKKKLQRLSISHCWQQE